MKLIHQIVFERIPDNSELSMADGRGYWAFSIFVGEEREGVGSADDLQTAMSMAQEMVPDIESGRISKGIKKGRPGAIPVDALNHT